MSGLRSEYILAGKGELTKVRVCMKTTFFSDFSFFRHLFIADWGDRHEGPDPCLYRCDMLADNCEIIVPDTLQTSIQYDADTDRIYWTDSHAGLIESARTDGTERFVITRLVSICFESHQSIDG